MNRDVTKNKRHNDEFDLDGRKINTMGYCIDTEENVVDREGGLVFKRALLSQTPGHGMDDEIPKIFRRNDRLNNYVFNMGRGPQSKSRSVMAEVKKPKKGVSDFAPTEMDRTARTGFNSHADETPMQRNETTTPEATLNRTDKSSMDQPRGSNMFSEGSSKAPINIHTGDDMHRVSDFHEPTVEVVKNGKVGMNNSKKHRPKTSNSRAMS